MSVVNVRPSLSASDSISYALYGVGKTKDKNLSAGTTRAAALTCSVGDPAEFVRLAHDIARAKSRKIEVYSYVQAFAPEEFNVNNPADVKHVHELGVKLAEKMHSADFVVVTHTDSVGGHLHNHVYVMNHDALSGKALTKYRSWTRGLHQLNDSLMREEGCEVLPSPVKAKDDWDTRRSSFTPGGFEQTLGDKIMSVLADDSIRDRASFERALEAEGVKISETNRDGLSYKMRRTTGKWGRRKASSLCDEFTAKSIEEIFDYRNKQNQEDSEMKLIDKIKMDTPQEDVQGEMQETAPVPQVETVQEEKSTALTEFTEEQKQEILRIYARIDEIRREAEREFDSEIDEFGVFTQGYLHGDLKPLAEKWGVDEIDLTAALDVVRGKKNPEKSPEPQKQEKPTPAPAVREEKSEKPVARTAKRSEQQPKRNQQPKQQQTRQQPYKQQQKQAEPLAPEEQAYDMALERAFRVLESGTNNFAVIIASWVSLVRAEHALIRYREQPTDAEMREIEERDEERYNELTRGEIAEAIDELEHRVYDDLRKQYKRGIKQVRKQQKQAQQQQDDGQDDGAPTLTPEQQRVHDAFHARQAIQRQQSELEL